MRIYVFLFLCSVAFSFQVVGQAAGRLPAKALPLPKTVKKTTPVKTVKKQTVQDTETATGWSASERKTFMSTCVPKTGLEPVKSKQYCACMLDKIEALYPLATDADKKLTTEKTNELARECLNNQPASLWTKANRAMFTKECEANAVEHVSKPRAKIYCACMLAKIELIYPNPLDANKITADEINKLAEKCNE